MRKANTSFVTDRIYAVNRSGLSFSLIEEAHQPPLKKDYDFSITEERVNSALATVAASEEGRLCGFAVVIEEEWNRRAVITDFFVDRQARRLGLGRSMLQIIFEQLIGKPHRILWVETQNVNFPAITFYRSAGFEVCGFDSTLYDGALSKEVAVFLSKRLECRQEEAEQDSGGNG